MPMMGQVVVLRATREENSKAERFSLPRDNEDTQRFFGERIMVSSQRRDAALINEWKISIFNLGGTAGNKLSSLKNHRDGGFYFGERLCCSMSYRLPRGTYDILGSDMDKWHWIEKIIHDLCRRSHYTEIRTPIFEQTELFVRGVGETTDIVGKEMYTFHDRRNRSLTLRPEGTAGIVRAFVEHKKYTENLPQKYYYLGPMFRYEKPQAGRFRQFHQFGVEVFGSDDPALDAEIIALGMEFFTALGLKNVRVEINSVGDQECRAVYRQRLVDYFSAYRDQLSNEDQIRLERNPMRILDSKDPKIQSLIAEAPVMLDDLNDSCRTHFEQLKAYLDALAIPYVVNPRLVRGLDYYTLTAFEFMTDVDGVHAGTIGGGGRYNRLVKELGGPELPGIGFGIGLERVLLACEQQQVTIPKQRELDCYLVVVDEESKAEALRLMFALRQAGLTSDMDYSNRKLKTQMKAAARLQARYALILGEDERKANSVSVKNLETGEQELIPFTEVVDRLTKE